MSRRLGEYGNRTRLRRSFVFVETVSCTLVTGVGKDLKSHRLLFLLCVVLGFTYLQYRVDPCTAHILGSLKSANPPERSISP